MLTQNSPVTSTDEIIKEYPNMFKIYIYHDHYYHQRDNSSGGGSSSLSQEQRDQINTNRSLRRTKIAISDIISSNDFEYWTTFTFNPKKIDRFNYDRCRATMTKWLLNQRNAHSPRLKYICVPEKHKSGAWHFHALLSNYNGQLKHTKHKTKNKQTVYNITGFRSGFTTAVQIDKTSDNIALAQYMTKYVTKDMISKKGVQRYLVSNNIKRPIVHRNALQRLGLSKLVWQKTPRFYNEFYECFYVEKSQLTP